MKIGKYAQIAFLLVLATIPAYSAETFEIGTGSEVVVVDIQEAGAEQAQVEIPWYKKSAAGSASLLTAYLIAVYAILDGDNFSPMKKGVCAALFCGAIGHIITVARSLPQSSENSDTNSKWSTATHNPWKRYAWWNNSCLTGAKSDAAVWSTATQDAVTQQQELVCGQQQKVIPQLVCGPRAEEAIKNFNVDYY